MKVIKKIILAVLVVIMMVCLCSSIKSYAAYKPPIARPHVTRSYLEYGVIASIDGMNIIFADHRGYTWAFTSEDWKLGDRVLVVMNNHGTRTIYDDSIVAVYRIGGK